MTIENLGAVPAANVNAYVNLEFVPGTEIPDSVPVEVGRKVLSEAVIGQNRHVETVIAWDSPAAAQWNEVNNGSTLFLIYCRLEYSDYFAKKQRTAIGCWQFDPSYREPTHAWIPAAKHNLL